MVRLTRWGPSDGKPAAVNVDSIPELEGVEHRLIDLSGGVTIHVADAGPADGPKSIEALDNVVNLFGRQSV